MPFVNQAAFEEVRRHQQITKYEIYPLQSEDIEDYQVLAEDIPSLLSEDVRILQKKAKTPFWAEEKGKAWSKIAKLMAKTPQLLFALSGNPSAKAADDGGNTFEFFDDFPGASLDNIPTSGDVTVAGDAGKYEAWPKIAKDSVGILYAVYRTCDTNTHMFCSTGKVVIKKSTDNGQTWGSEITVSDVANIDDRNPAIMVFDDNGTETLLVAYREYDGVDGNDRVYVKKSINAGVSWGSAIAISAGNCRAVSGSPILLSNGKILLPLYNWFGGITSCYVAESNDGGDTWTEYTVTTSYASEFSIIETKTGGSYTGGVYGIIRDDTSPYVFKEVKSIDYGHTWSAPVDQTDFDEMWKIPLTFHRAPNDELLATYTKTSGSVVIYESTDEGNNWIYKTSVVNVPNLPYYSFYPNIETINSSKLIIIWCTNVTTSDVYVNFIDYPIQQDYKWQLNRGAITVENSYAKMNGGQEDDFFAIPTWGANYSIREKVKLTTGGRFGWVYEAASWTHVAMNFANLDKTRTRVSSLDEDKAFSFSADEAIYDIHRNSTTNVIFKKNSVVQNMHTVKVPSADMRPYFYIAAGGDIWINWILIRKYASLEPLILQKQISGKADAIRAVVG